ncbi:pPIWI-associating nuclease domain-containing protein [Rhodobacter sp. NSM]|uniref:pPIWI-associating nuclease domain-containing protein n=1 Tax=Rhodobacter sp. NSM TaxID=3457501 RepID=UPI003FD12B63
MARRMTPSQFRSALRQREQKINQAINKLNQANKKAISAYNAIVRAHNAEVKRRRQAYLTAVAQYNHAVALHNSKAQVRQPETQKLIVSMRAPTRTNYVSTRTTSIEVLQRFEQVAVETPRTEEHKDLISMAAVERDNAALLARILFPDEEGAAPPHLDDENEPPTGILSYLSDLSEDLLLRWKGAMFALNPANPDAARHFCTSAREIFTEILERWADDREVIEANPQCQKTPQGTKPTRRAKIQYLLEKKGADTAEMIGFVDADIENVVQLFAEFNQGTHGPARKFAFEQLQAIRRRVEGGIMFLATIAA